MNKICSGCKESKQLANFYKASKLKDGYDYYCKQCRNNANGKVRDKVNKQCNVDDCNKGFYANGYCRMHYERLRTQNRLHSITTPYHPDKVYVSKHGYEIKALDLKKNMLWFRYKVTLERYEEMCANGCHICGDKPERSLEIDHDHSCCDSAISCGRCVRGVLCGRCNVAVAKFENGTIRDNYPLMSEIAEYLDR